MSGEVTAVLNAFGEMLLSLFSLVFLPIQVLQSQADH